MKKFVLILSFIFSLSITSIAQDGENGSVVKEKMMEYIQKRLNLSKPEAERFGPVFMNYFNDLRKTRQNFKNDQLRLQQKTAELKLEYRNRFSNIIGEKRGNDVFTYERDFIDEVKKIRMERSIDRKN
jgi:hypothetical protein